LTRVLGGGDSVGGRSQTLVAFTQTRQTGVGFAVTGFEIGLAAAANIHFRAGHHGFHARLASRASGHVLSLRLAQFLSGLSSGRGRGATGCHKDVPEKSKSEKRETGFLRELKRFSTPLNPAFLGKRSK
jgi:hypothetical protein